MSYYDELQKAKEAMRRTFEDARKNNNTIREKDLINEMLYHYTVSEKAIKRLIQQAYAFDKTMHREEGDIWFGEERHDPIPGKEETARDA